MLSKPLNLSILSLFFIMLTSCKQVERTSQTEEEAYYYPNSNPLTISTHQGISRYQVFINGKKMVIYRQAPNIIISYPKLIPMAQTPADIILSPNSNGFNEVNAFLNSVFEFRAETVMVIYMGTIANEIIYDKNGQEITISDANVKKFNLNLVQNNQTTLAKLYLDNKRALTNPIVNYYMQIGWP